MEKIDREAAARIIYNRLVEEVEHQARERLASFSVAAQKPGKADR